MYIVPALMQDFAYASVIQVPRLTKISINMGVGEAIENPKALEAALNDLTRIAGQKPKITKAKKSIAAFKLREGMEIGAMVTLRRSRMWHFLDRLTSVALPRVRDFRGLSPRGMDGYGKCGRGVREQIVLTEVG